MIDVERILLANGQIIQRAMWRMRSLTGVERMIIENGRKTALNHGYAMQSILNVEFDGIRGNGMSYGRTVETKFVGMWDSYVFGIKCRQYHVIGLHKLSDQTVDVMTLMNHGLMPSGIWFGHAVFEYLKTAFVIAYAKARIAFMVLAVFGLMGCNNLERLLHGREVDALRHNPPTQTDEVISVGVTGQSNGVSMAITATDRAYSTTGMVTLIDENGTETSPTAQNPADTSLAWVYLGDMIATRTGKRVRIVNLSIGSTDSTQWATQYASRIAGAESKYNLDFVLWVQGENDTFNHFSTETSYQNLKSIIAQAGSVPFYCALDGYMPGLDKEPVRDAQKRVIAEGLARQGPDIDALRLNPANMEWTLIHFSGQGFASHAQAWFDILQGVL